MAQDGVSGFTSLTYWPVEARPWQGPLLLFRRVRRHSPGQAAHDADAALTAGAVERAASFDTEKSE